MTLTDNLRQQIDNMDYRSMLSQWRFANIGDSMFQGESGEYFSKRMFALRDADPQAAVSASKSIGWDQ